MVGWIDRDKIGIRPFVRSSVPPSYLLFLLLSILSILSFAFYPSIPPSLSFAFYDKATAILLTSPYPFFLSFTFYESILSIHSFYPSILCFLFILSLSFAFYESFFFILLFILNGSGGSRDGGATATATINGK